MGVQMFDPFITLAQHILWCKEWMRNSLFYRIMEDAETFVNENKKKAKFS